MDNVRYLVVYLHDILSGYQLNLTVRLLSTVGLTLPQYNMYVDFVIDRWTNPNPNPNNPRPETLPWKLETQVRTSVCPMPNTFVRLFDRWIEHLDYGTYNIVRTVVLWGLNWKKCSWTSHLLLSSTHNAHRTTQPWRPPTAMGTTLLRKNPWL